MNELDRKLAELADQLSSDVDKLDTAIGPASEAHIRLECLKLATAGRTGWEAKYILMDARDFADFVFGLEEPDPTA